MSSIRINIDFPVVVEKVDSYYIASCDKLDIHAEGKTHQISLNHILEALEVFVVSCVEMGTLEEVLRESGFKKIIHEEKRKPNLKEETVSVPISLMAVNSNAKKQAFAC